MSRKRDLVNKYSWITNSLIKVSRIFPKRFYLSLMKVIRSHDNNIALLIRYICLKNCTKFCGENVAVFSNVYLYNLHNLEIGNNVSIHPLCYINASGEIKIGNDVSIAHNSTVMSEEHNYSDINKNIKDQGYKFMKTTIEDNVWVGSGVRILGGSYIETGSIIAAGAVVKGTIKTNSIVGGVPAKLIKERV
ncbi:acetyltransferase-like isoleucine patch superfamily enzyme [Natranaerovirga pectinivora]|uniref:Acetyltransferase-like isoleucine patch superfamily enzyme n=1 Tax=Natranaerovirga pectinivora TaxID=682400 RepID=A0A4R3MG48_9FIRM|nr:acyltransferase [Natranaerovirga pectinivora]TCT12858.1 acetyltransferase-like isoleucine patch superfamily enzyme [Natranaerovirga pectinivora]